MGQYPAAYLRRSHVDANDRGDISEDMQRVAIRRLAEADGHNGDVEWYRDWGVSADVRKAERRTDFIRLLADMAAGRVSDLYAYDVDRILRDPRDLIRLQDAAERHNVRVVTTAGILALGRDADPGEEASAYMKAIFGRYELRQHRKRAAAARARKMARGDRFGHAPYGFLHQPDPEQDGRIVRVPDPEARVADVLAAVREAGTILGAVKVLNERGIPGPKGGLWHSSTLRRVVGELDPTLLPPRGASGRREHGRSALAQLVRCHCGQTMTPNVARGQLYCYVGQRRGVRRHGRAHVTEAALLPYVRREAARYRPPGVVATEPPPDTAEQRAAVEARLRRATAAHIEGRITDDEMDAEKVRATDAIEALDAEQGIRDLIPQGGEDDPIIEWDWPAENINRVLRILIDHFQLDRDMKPIESETVWRDERWRGPKRRRPSRSA